MHAGRWELPVAMLLREVHVRRPHRTIQAVAIGVFACLAAMAMAVAFLGLATGCYHAALPPRPRALMRVPPHPSFTMCSADLALLCITPCPRRCEP